MKALHIMAVGILIAGCGHRPEHDPRLDPPLVRSAVVESRGTSPARRFTGIVAARVESDLGFRVPGKVLQRFVSSGESVHRGQPLMRLDDVDLRLALNAEQQAMVAAAARAKQVTDDETRDRNLVSDGAEPFATYDRMRASAEAARAQLVAAKAQADVARNATGYALLVADADGVVVETLAEPGQVIGPGQIVVRLAQEGPREALVQLPETLRPPLGSTAQATLYGSPGAVAQARLRELSSAADPVTRTFQARYVLEGPLADAALGATVTVTLSGDGAPSEMQVPIGAVFDPGAGPGVWLVADAPTHVVWRPILVDRLDDDSVVVKNGISPGQRIVALGAHLLHEGQEVRVGADAGAP